MLKSQHADGAIMQTKTQILKVLAPYEARLVSIISEAWQAWRASPYPARWRANRSRASFVWEEMIERAIIEFSDDPAVKIVPKDETFWFVVDQRLIFRLKKGDLLGHSRNIPTQSVLAYHDPEQSLEGFDVDRIEILYAPNEMGTAIDDILVVARDKDRVAWVESLLERASVAPLSPPFDPAAAPVPQPARSSVVRVRVEDGKISEADVAKPSEET